MQTVVLIEEDNHGLIGVAKDYPSAIVFLVNENWLDGKFEVWVDNEDYLTQTIKEDLGEEWKEVVLSWDIETFSNYFEGYFYLTIEEVYGAD